MRPMRWRRTLRRPAGAALGAIVGFMALGAAAEPSLTVVAGGHTAIYTAAGLLTLPAATTVTIPADVAVAVDLAVPEDDESVAELENLVEREQQRRNLEHGADLRVQGRRAARSARPTHR